MPKTAYTLLAFLMLAVPAAAQIIKPTTADQKECADRFKQADINNDGTLDNAEIGSAKDIVPAALANRSSIARADFLAACSKKD